MLVNRNESRNWSAVSAVNVSEGSGDPVMYMNAAFNGKDLNFSKNIQNYELYKVYKDEADTDYETFEKDVYKEIGQGE